MANNLRHQATIYPRQIFGTKLSVMVSCLLNILVGNKVVRVRVRRVRNHGGKKLAHTSLRTERQVDHWLIVFQLIQNVQVDNPGGFPLNLRGPIDKPLDVGQKLRKSQNRPQSNFCSPTAFSDWYSSFMLQNVGFAWLVQRAVSVGYTFVLNASTFAVGFSTPFTSGSRHNDRIRRIIHDLFKESTLLRSSW